ncbi:MAG: M50 family metallopeptidase [Calothrix sp. FI2-JRJ7]|jgi:RimJ/RimL family protein N-acetyltransferase|nr:M50 family metallopeptidase [Calothrix sp. FI2-JRJ7]
MFSNSSFDLISILYSIISLDTIIRLLQSWSSVWDDSVTAKDKLLIQRTAAFILIPFGVFFHEFGHAVATWLFGGQVREFQWRLFWGYVVPVGNFTTDQIWWIAFSGNLISILLGIIAILILPVVKKPALKELFYTFAIAQLVYSLIFYPLVSFTGFRGDWLTIYDFSIQPYAQVTLVLHIALLLTLWQGTKKKWLDKYLIDNSNKTQTIIETPRLIIREFTMSDVDDLAYILSKPEVMHFSPTGAISTEETAIKIKSYIDSYQQHGYGKWAVIYRNTGKLIGYCGIAIEQIDNNLENELGYRFDPDYWRQGFATEAATSCINYAFDTLNLEYLLGIVEPENTASVRVLQKIGMEFVKESLWCDKIVHIYRKEKENNG